MPAVIILLGGLMSMIIGVFYLMFLWVYLLVDFFISIFVDAFTNKPLHRGGTEYGDLGWNTALYIAGRAPLMAMGTAWLAVIGARWRGPLPAAQVRAGGYPGLCAAASPTAAAASRRARATTLPSTAGGCAGASGAKEAGRPKPGRGRRESRRPTGLALRPFLPVQRLEPEREADSNATHDQQAVRERGDRD